MRVGSKPSTPATPRAVSPKAQQVAITAHAEALIKDGKLEFNGKAPKKIDILRQFEVKNVRPFTYAAIQLKSGEIVIKKVLTGGFVPARPGDGSYTAPMKFPNVSGS